MADLPPFSDPRLGGCCGKPHQCSVLGPPCALLNGPVKRPRMLVKKIRDEQPEELASVWATLRRHTMTTYPPASESPDQLGCETPDGMCAFGAMTRGNESPEKALTRWHEHVALAVLVDLAKLLGQEADRG